LYEPQFQFDWDEAKAVGNLHKHGISFELASSVFSDPRILTIADLEHSEWKNVGSPLARPTMGQCFQSRIFGRNPKAVKSKIRLITARRATAREVRYYIES
jgi:uncharacterized DUF497 family protein